MNAYDEKVAKGAAALDAKRPGWANEIDLDNFNQNYGAAGEGVKCCILAQLYGAWTKGLTTLFNSQSHDISEMHGFSRDEQGGKPLQKAWIKLITERRALAPAPFNVDDFIKEHGARLEQMYTDRTAGDYSFTGFVVTVLMDLRDKGVQLP